MTAQYKMGERGGGIDAAKAAVSSVTLEVLRQSFC